MIGQKMSLVAAALLAMALAFLLAGMSYVLFPEQPSQEPPIGTPVPKPETLTDQLFWSIQWIGIAAFIALAAVGAMLLITKIRSKKTPMRIV